MVIVRFLGWALVLVGVVLFAHDAAVALRDHGALAPMSFDYFTQYYGIARVSALVGHVVVVDFWRPVAAWIGLCWAFAVCIVAGGLILVLRRALFGRRRRR
jgi:hypothetical protein